MSQIYSLIKYTATLVGHCKQFLCGALRDLENVKNTYGGVLL